MGDHRVSIKIQFEMHGHKDKRDAWLNWHEGIPQDFADWIEEQKSKAMDKWYERVYKLEEMKRAEEENRERALLAQLKAKYENNV